MYEAYYGLTEKPFNLTPDPRFLYLSPKHKEAFAHLMYGIRNRSGFVMVSGEIGTGKTTICRSLLKQVDPDTEVAFIFNPYLSPMELLKKINHDFGIDSKAESVRELIDELNAYLLTKAAEGKNCVLIIDEAQNLGTDILEQIRLLSNLETETQKLLQIILIGQPELAQKLELYEMRQLNQRITARYHLEALNPEESLHYVAFRLRVAGGGDKIRFNRKAVKLIHKISNGTPRVINALCDRALLIGYTKELSEITPQVIRQAAQEIQGEGHVEFKRLNTGGILRMGGIFSLTAAGILAFLIFSSDDGLSWKNAEERLRSQWAAILPVASSGDAPAIDDIAENEPAVETESENTTETPNEVADQVVAKAMPPEAVKTEAATVTREKVKAAPKLNRVVAQSGALSGILRAWNLAEIQPLPKRASRNAMYSFSRANGLTTTPLQVTLSELGRVNYPALIEVDFGEGKYWSALLALTEREATVTDAEGGKVGLVRSALERAYQGSAIVCWVDAAPGSEPLRANSRTDAVSSLQADLLKLGLTDRQPSGVYDGGTIETVTQIQRTTGIISDGICGAQTRMVLSAWLGDDTRPHLADVAFPDSVRRAVEGSLGMVVAQPLEVNEETATPIEELSNETVEAAVAERSQESRELPPENDVRSDDTELLLPRERFAAPAENTDEGYTPLLSPNRDKPLDSVTGPADLAVPLQPSTSAPAEKSVTP